MKGVFYNEKSNRVHQNPTAVIALILCALLISSFSSFAEFDLDEPLLPEEPYVDVSQVRALLSISSSGRATCKGVVTMSTSSNYCDMTVTLQREVDDCWEDVKSWSATDSANVSLVKNWYVSTGYYYRVVVEGDVYDAYDNYIESVYMDSTEQFY